MRLPVAEIPEPSPGHMAALRREKEKFFPQMHHCTRCRADAVGLLEEDRGEEFRSCLTNCSETLVTSVEPYVAVATREGALVNLLLGEAPAFQIWERRADGAFYLVEERAAPPPGSGSDRWWALAQTLRDCRAVLVSALGETPRAILQEAGIMPVEMDGLIETGLTAVYEGRDLKALRALRGGLAKACSGGGPGSGCG